MDTAIDYGIFKNLTGNELVAYIGDEWEDRQLSPGFLDSCLDEIEQFDEYHLVYALEFGALLDPERFAPLLPKYLADRRTSVWTAAYRALRRIPSITTEVYKNIELHAPRCSDQDLADFLEHMKRKVVAPPSSMADV